MDHKELDETINAYIMLYNFSESDMANAIEIAKYFYHTGKADGLKEGLKALKNL